MAVPVLHTLASDVTRRAHRVAGGILTIDLGAVAANYRLLRERAAPAMCAAVVKADAYGLGAAHVAPTLYGAGCRLFFVAQLEEGVSLRRHLPPDATIAVLNGNLPGTEPDFAEHHLVPVLNSMEQVAAWLRFCGQGGRPYPAMLQVDTGMARFGLSDFEAEGLARDADARGRLDLRAVISHLACADEPENTANAKQLSAFRRVRELFPDVPASLAASSGIFLGPGYHFDIVRPGAALYGVAPQNGAANPLRPVVRLQGCVVQVREVPAGTAVGYGHSAVTAHPSRLATIAVGYADGLLRSASNRAAAWHGDKRLPLVGRVSMDSVVVDISALPEGAVSGGSLLDLIGPSQDIDATAQLAGTIGYEMLTGLGARFQRIYVSA